MAREHPSLDKIFGKQSPRQAEFRAWLKLNQHAPATRPYREFLERTQPEAPEKPTQQP
jgi:hypothetical protein